MSLTDRIARATTHVGRPGGRHPAPAPTVVHTRLIPESSTAIGFDDAGRSLRVACLVWVALWSFGLFMNNVVGPLISPDEPLDDAWPWPANPIAFGCILVSLGLFTVSRRQDLPAGRLIDLALAYEVIIALAIGIVNQWTPNTVGLSWIAVVILVHPLLVPAPLGKAFCVSLAAASMDFVGLGIAGARGVELPAASVLAWTYLPNYLCAVIAVIPAHVRVRMEEHHSKARELGSYKVGELLSRGGMGEIYRAEHRMLLRPAAVKLIRPDIFGTASREERQRAVQRFQREAKLTAGLRSPHTVAVYDFGVARDGSLYYVMELLDGLDLDVLVRRFGPMPAARAVQILLQVCDSLGEAHEKGLVHRDIKPSNVYLTRYGSHMDVVKVLDFGLARRAEIQQQDVRLTAEVSMLGTPGFMAPEQIVGEPPAGPRTDLYGVGCLAYWLLTGQLVHEGARALEVVAHHLDTPPLPPSQRTELPIPEALDRVVLACLEKEPERRPASANALAAHLAAIHADPSWTDERARHWWRAHVPSEPTGTHSA